MKIHTLSIPSTQTMHCERVAKIIRTRPYATSFRFQPGSLEQFPQCLCRGADRQRLSADSNKEAVVWPRNRAGERLPSREILIHFVRQRAMKWYPSRSPFEHLYEEDTRVSVNVMQAKAESLSETDAGAIQQQEKHPI